MSGKNSFLIKTTSPDITFCASLCKNQECSRNMDGKLWKIKAGPRVVCDYGRLCTEYKKGGE